METTNKNSTHFSFYYIFDFFSFIQKTGFDFLRNQFSTDFSFKIFEPFIASPPQNRLSNQPAKNPARDFCLMLKLYGVFLHNTRFIIISYAVLETSLKPVLFYVAKEITQRY